MSQTAHNGQRSIAICIWRSLYSFKTESFLERSAWFLLPPSAIPLTTCHNRQQVSTVGWFISQSRQYPLSFSDILSRGSTILVRDSNILLRVSFTSLCILYSATTFSVEPNMMYYPSCMANICLSVRYISDMFAPACDNMKPQSLWDSHDGHPTLTTS